MKFVGWASRKGGEGKARAKHSIMAARTVQRRAHADPRWALLVNCVGTARLALLCLRHRRAVHAFAHPTSTAEVIA